MKTPCGAVLLCVAAVIICGCASHRAGPAYHAGDEVPPPFLTGPAAVLLTNLNGFSAHVTATVVSPEGMSHTRSGELLGRDGRLLYQPTLAIKGKRARTEGGLFFIWDEEQHSGYMMSEALQGYAPLQEEGEQATQFTINNEGVQEDVNGHPCHRCQALVELNNGAKLRATLWEADDARHFPVRMETLDGVNRITLDFSEIRLEYPARVLFLPPDGFTPYTNSVALMNELIVRDSSLTKRQAQGEFDEPTDVRSSNWRATPASGNY